MFFPLPLPAQIPHWIDHFSLCIYCTLFLAVCNFHFLFPRGRKRVLHPYGRAGSGHDSHLLPWDHLLDGVDQRPGPLAAGEPAPPPADGVRATLQTLQRRHQQRGLQAVHLAVWRKGTHHRGGGLMHVREFQRGKKQKTNHGFFRVCLFMNADTMTWMCSFHENMAG